MIAHAENVDAKPRTSEWQLGFLDMLPRIQAYACAAFRNYDPESREDAIQEVVANALTAYVRLCARGKQDIAYPLVLARFAVAQFRDGRRVGTKSNCRDALSCYARRRRGDRLLSLDGRGHCGEWKKVLVESRQAGPAETAASRIDFAEWLKQLPTKKRKLAMILAVGETTSAAAKKLGVTRGRVSQLRRELMNSWFAYQGEAVPTA
jgi:hypothetical protein